MIRLALGLALACFPPLTAAANPVVLPRPGQPVPESSTIEMIAEDVVVTVSRHVAEVKGRFRFLASPAHEQTPFKPFQATIWLPIPVPSSATIGPDDVRPKLRYRGSELIGKLTADPVRLPRADGMKYARADFALQIDAPEFDVEIEYEHPLVERRGQRFAYYVPLLSPAAISRHAAGDGSHRISFVTSAPLSLRLATADAVVLKATPQEISVQPENRQLLEVELLLPRPPLIPPPTLEPLHSEAPVDVPTDLAHREVQRFAANPDAPAEFWWLSELLPPPKPARKAKRR